MEANEMCEWFETIIENLIKTYKNKYEYYEWESYWNLGAIEALEELLREVKQ